MVDAGVWYVGHYQSFVKMHLQNINHAKYIYVAPNLNFTLKVTKSN